MDAKAGAVIVADSLAPSGVRLTTALIRIATIVLQDVHTHRTVYQFVKPDGDTEWADIVSNKSTNSNRAKPTKQVLWDVWRDPFCPERFPVRAATMHSSRGYLEGCKHHVARHLWLKARYIMMFVALLLMWSGCHKQIANRLLSPWQWTVIVMTAVDVYWNHFIGLRHHYMAQDQVQEAAEAFHMAYDASTPDILAAGEWHTPFITKSERDHYSEPVLLRLSIARCARTSYASDLESMIEIASQRPVYDDLMFYNQRLAPMKPPHDGPREHQASAHADSMHRSGTLHGWDQLRHTDMAGHLEILAQIEPSRTQALAERYAPQIPGAHTA